MSDTKKLEERNKLLGFCADCGAALSRNARFCPGCGMSVSAAGRFCAECGAVVSPEAEFCSTCGNARGAPAPASSFGTFVGRTTGVLTARLSPPWARRPNWLVITAVVTVVAVALGLGLGLGLRDQVPVVETPLASPYTDEMPGETWDVVATPDEEVTLSARGAEVWVPKGAVIEPTSVSIVMFTESYEDHEFSSAPLAGYESLSEDMAVFAVSSVYDVGPGGVRFEEPAKVTIGYDDRALPQGSTEADLLLAYYDGDRWVPVSARMDKDANTASVSVESFEGELITVLGVTAVATGALALWAWYEQDEIQRGNASRYITPEAPVVVGWADRAVLAPMGRDGKTYDPGDAVSLSNPEAVKRLLRNGDQWGWGYRRPSSDEVIWQTYSVGPGTNFQMPSTYLKERECVGDCTDFTSATVSVLRHLGFQAKGVSGYDAGDMPHAWVEVVFDGEPFLIEPDGGTVYPLAEGLKVLKLRRPSRWDNRNAMWDENGQSLYLENWWTYLTVSTTTTNTTLDSGHNPDQPTGEYPGIDGIDVTELVENMVLKEYRVVTRPGQVRGFLTFYDDYDRYGEHLYYVWVFECDIIGGQPNYSNAGRVHWEEGPVEEAGEALARCEAVVTGVVNTGGWLETIE